MARRRFDPFSLSFLDCMCCGFGAVILVFMIISNRITVQAEVITQVRKIEMLRLGARVDAQREMLAETEQELEHAELELATITDELQARGAQLRAAGAQIARARAYSRESSEEIKKAQEQRKSRPPPKTHVRKVLNRGNRQYLTGMRMDAQRAMILIDTSASMLDRTIVNVVIRRNMSPEARRRAPKWSQAVATVDWLTANLDPGAQYQIYSFGTQAKPLLEGTGGKWLDVGDGKRLDEAMERLRQLVPTGGTSLWAAFRAVETMNPRPDNVYLLVDGLPTVGSEPAKRATVSGQQREKLFERAVERLPSGVAVNVILFPFEGDPGAASAFWELSIHTRGSYLSPSEHWP
jgi:hypothetical protein